MGDIGHIINGAVATAASGLVGLVHGGIDATSIGESMPSYGHDLVTYGTIAGAAYFTGSSDNGLWTRKSRIQAGIGAGVLSAGAMGVGYLVGKIAVTGFKDVFGL